MFTTQEQLLQQAQDLVKYCNFTKSGRSKEAAWEDCWAETLREFIENDYDTKVLFPAFVGNGNFIRYHGSYNNFCEKELFKYHRQNILNYIPKDTSTIVELGSGSGHNTVYFAKEFPDKKIIGYDWSESAVNILNILSRQYPNISGHTCDLLIGHQDGGVFPHKTTVVTFHAFEQLGDDFENAVDMILHEEPQMVIQTEPVFEFYDEANPFDKVAMDYHKKRNYLEGYWPYLQDLESKGMIKIHQAKKSEFGNFFHDGYSLLVWEPL